MSPITPTSRNVSHEQDLAAIRQSEKTQAKEGAKQSHQSGMQVENAEKSPFPVRMAIGDMRLSMRRRMLLLSRILLFSHRLSWLASTLSTISWQL